MDQHPIQREREGGGVEWGLLSRFMLQKPEFSTRTVNFLWPKCLFSLRVKPPLSKVIPTAWIPIGNGSTLFTDVSLSAYLHTSFHCQQIPSCIGSDSCQVRWCRSYWSDSRYNHFHIHWYLQQKKIENITLLTKNPTCDSVIQKRLSLIFLRWSTSLSLTHSVWWLRSYGDTHKYNWIISVFYFIWHFV